MTFYFSYLMRTLEKTACSFLPKYIAFLLDEMDLIRSNKIDDGAKADVVVYLEIWENGVFSEKIKWRKKKVHPQQKKKSLFKSSIAVFC